MSEESTQMQNPQKGTDQFHETLMQKFDTLVVL